MKNNYIFLLLLSVILVSSKTSVAQIETRLATNCAVENVEIPIIIKNLENIKAFELKLLFNDDLLRFDTSLYHYADFLVDNFQIEVSASNDTLTISRPSSYYSVNVVDDLLLSLVFSQKGGTGDASFTWVEDECFYKNISELIIDADYFIDSDLSIPFNSSVKISFDQFTIGCRDGSESGGCKAQAEVNIIGGQAPYTYQWNDKFSQNDSIAIGLCQDPISVIIRDDAGCVFGSIFDAVIYPAAVYEINANPEEVYITTPVVEFTIETDDEYIENYLWDFGDETSSTAENATHVYSQINNFMVSLRTENIDGCDTTVSIPFEVKELNFCIPNVFTPNGDTYNDEWIFKIIDGSGGDSSGGGLKSTGYEDIDNCSGTDLIFDEHFKSSSLVVLNRNGRTVYECINCTEYWDGGNLPDGVYFYVFIWEGQLSSGKEQGTVTILGRKR